MLTSAVNTGKCLNALLFCIVFLVVFIASSNRQIYASGTTNTARIMISANGPFELIVNRKVIKSSDMVDMIEIEAPIHEGTNDVLLKLHQGTAAIRIKARGIDIMGDGWRMMPLNIQSSKRFDDLLGDSAWVAAPKYGNHALLGSIMGKPNQPTVLQRTILWKKTRVWPSPVPAFYLPENATMRMNFVVDGIAGRRLQNWTTYLAVPPEIECIGSSSFYGTWDRNQPLFTTTHLGKTKIEGQLVDYYRISADKPIDSSKADIAKILQVFLRYKGNSHRKHENMNIIYWSEANNGGVIEGRQSVPVHLIGALNGKQPRQFVFELCGGWFFRLDNPEMRNEILKTARLAGFNHFLCNNNEWCADNVPHNGMKNIIAMNFGSGSIDLTEHLKTHRGDRLVTQDGVYSESLMCTTKMLNDGRRAVESAIQKMLARLKPHVADYDYEFSPLNGPHSCYCPACLAHFRAFAKLPESKQLTPLIIKENYRKLWVDFMAKRVAAIFKLLRDSIHQLSPGTQFSVYSGYQTPDNAERYGVNWYYVGELSAVDKAGCGYGKLVATVKETINALKGIPLVGGVIVTPYNINETSPPNELTTAKILRQFFDSTGGILAYSYMEMGGRSYQAVSHVSKFVSSFEEILWHGDRFSLKGYDEEEVIGIKYGRTMLICLMNNRISPRHFTLKIPYAGKDGFRFFKKQKLDRSDQIDCILEPGEIEILVFNSLNSGAD